jgi:FkbH-like protein
MNGVYQQLLRSLAEAGVLVAAASKNDPAVVAAALGRQDLILPQACIFPVEIQWGPKSQSVARILEAWNIGADAVVFVDDSRMELAEVQSAFPEIECLEFPRGREQAIYELLETLRDRFGKPRVSTEDAIRLRSIRDGQFVRERFQAPDASPSSFLEQAAGELTLDFNKHPLDPRALELVNKTNQFNLNGKRRTESAWRAYLQDAGTFLLVFSYQDRYGPLGKIAVITGRSSGDTVLVENWVMSCRAFARQIEHHCLRQLFERYGAGEVAFNFEPTSRNGPLREFFAGILGEAPTGGFRLAKRDFLNAYPRMFHRIKDAASAALVPQAG